MHPLRHCFATDHESSRYHLQYNGMSARDHTNAVSLADWGVGIEHDTTCYRDLTVRSFLLPLRKGSSGKATPSFCPLNEISRQLLVEWRPENPIINGWLLCSMHHLPAMPTTCLDGNRFSSDGRSKRTEDQSARSPAHMTGEMARLLAYKPQVDPQVGVLLFPPFSSSCSRSIFHAFTIATRKLDSFSPVHANLKRLQSEKKK